MLGFSIYLDRPINGAQQDYIQTMAQAGFVQIFTSLHIPEMVNEALAQRFLDLAQVCQTTSLSLMVDVDAKTFKHYRQILEQAATYCQLKLRLDDGFGTEEMVHLAQQWPIVLNASTLTDELLTGFIEHGGQTKSLSVGHNFYPQPYTGLDSNWFQQRNRWLKQRALSISAFVPGNGSLRGPLYQGLPTLEQQRHQDPLLAAKALFDQMVDDVFIGDPQLVSSTQLAFKQYFQAHIVKLEVQLVSSKWRQVLGQHIWHNRPDVAAEVIRCQESRQLNQQATVLPEHCIARQTGAITINNQLYGRYQGEIQICRTELPADPAVNVIGQLTPAACDYLALIGSRIGIQLQI
ncbi:MupG family TIM beta-alpha barrel fold protein [Agrilactobacillus fermenti]|uniref:MupG family TIM beta-alpha barrel fold protein n=1 Tax=Agrilactobacillus fermenti TaxID=2586909 RepID=UPI001E5076D8|nr:MupG family TIM beta-alpha barrel fold protein [Agrilactobacillus fermenti]MCD2257312.1 DUF871 domain-containing protein [Agrilactobacillus fermenti]